MPHNSDSLFAAPVDKPFMNTLVEDVRINPNQGVLANVGDNLARAGDKMIMRNRYHDRARQMNMALEEWQQQQALLRQQRMALPRQPLPLPWPKFAPAW